MQGSRAKREIASEALFFAGIAIFLFLFYTRVRPMIIFDGDDWQGATTIRPAYPTLSVTNPIKVLPETLMPILSYAAELTTIPMLGSFFGGISVIYALALTAFLTGYLYAFYRLVGAYGRPKLMTVIFLIAHFGVFRTQTTDNTWMWSAMNTTSMFHYLIPGVMGGMMTMLLMRRDIYGAQQESGNMGAEAAFLLGGYLAIFSSLYHSVIFAAYAGAVCLVDVISGVKKGGSPVPVIKARLNHIIVLAAWLVSLFIESQGKRAGDFGGFDPWLALRTLLSWRRRVNPLIMTVLILSLVFGIGAYVLSEKNEEDRRYIVMLIRLAAASAATGAFLVLLAARTGAAYLERSETIYGAAFYGLLMCMWSLAYGLSRAPRVYLVLPLCVFAMLCTAITGTHVFRDLNEGPDTGTALALSEDVYAQIKDAEAAGLTYSVIYVPRFAHEDNWPLATYMGVQLEYSMYRLGQTGRLMELEVRVDESKNAEYGLPLP